MERASTRVVRGREDRARHGSTLTALLVTSFLSSWCAGAYGQDIDAESDRIPGLPEPSIASNLPKQLADPGGVRAMLAGRGVTYAVNYVGDAMENPVGGFSQDARYIGRLDLELNADLEKIAGWPGLTFFANAYQIHGQSISAMNLGALMPVSFIEALPSTRLFEIYLEQKLLDGHMTFRVGQLSADSEFAISEATTPLMNGSWGWPAIMGTNLPEGGPSYPVASPAARIAFNPNDTLGFLVGVFSGNPAGNCPPGELPQQCNPNGLLFPFTSPLLIVEADIKYNQREGELAGKLKLGAWRDFGAYVPDQVGSNGLPIGLVGVPGTKSDKDYGFYAILEQMIYRVPGPGEPRGITLFSTYMIAPPEGNLIEDYFEAGASVYGLLDARPRDRMAMGFIYTGVSSQVIDFYRSIGDPVIPSFEGVFEASYTAEIVKGLYLQPDFQYFWNPGGHTNDPTDPAIATPNAAVLGMRTTINY